jgi:phosphoribosylformylglycinamidine (FGAM) synthase-like amidotransferase family enzyme
MPIAHAEGRFVTRDPEVERALAEGDQIVLRYCRHDGAEAGGFPHNPNGSLLDAAGISNPAGNVVAMMPHPERAALLHQVAWELDGPWGEQRRAVRDHESLIGSGPGLAVFSSMRRYLEGRGDRLTAARESSHA